MRLQLRGRRSEGQLCGRSGISLRLLRIWLPSRQHRRNGRRPDIRAEAWRPKQPLKTGRSCRVQQKPPWMTRVGQDIVDRRVRTATNDGAPKRLKIPWATPTGCGSSTKTEASPESGFQVCHSKNAFPDAFFGTGLEMFHRVTLVE